jgi:hypothetical protein
MFAWPPIPPSFQTIPNMGHLARYFQLWYFHPEPNGFPGVREKSITLTREYSKQNVKIKHRHYVEIQTE